MNTKKEIKKEINRLLTNVYNSSSLGDIPTIKKLLELL